MAFFAWFLSKTRNEPILLRGEIYVISIDLFLIFFLKPMALRSIAIISVAPHVYS